MFGLKAAVAIRLRSTCNGSSDFVLEFFLPTNCNDPGEQKEMLTSLSMIDFTICHGQRVARRICFAKDVPKVYHVQFPVPYSRQVIHEESGIEVSPSSTEKSRETLLKSSEIRFSQSDSISKEDMKLFTNTSTSCNGSSMYTSKTGEKRTITLKVLRRHFAGSLKDAARNLGVCPTTLKRICRQHGIQRWPSRKLRKVGHSLQKIQRVIDSVLGASGVLQIESFNSNFPELASPDASRTTQFSNSKSDDNLKPLDGQPESSILRPRATASVSPSSSCSHSSNSSDCCSSGAQPNSYSLCVEAHEDQLVEEEPVSGMLKRGRSDANLHLSSGGSKPLPRSQGHVSFCWPDKQENFQLAAEDTGPRYRETDSPRIKVSYGEDTIRFRMQNNWRYKDLLQEISRRFGVDNSIGFHLKYLYDDAEWVLLTCDVDLEDCIDVCRSSRSQTMRLSFLRDFQSRFGRSISNICPSSL